MLTLLYQVGQLGGQSDLLGLLYGSDLTPSHEEYGLGSGIQDFPAMPYDLEYFHKRTFEVSNNRLCYNHLYLLQKCIFSLQIFLGFKLIFTNFT